MECEALQEECRKLKIEVQRQKDKLYKGEEQRSLEATVAKQEAALAQQQVI